MQQKRTEALYKLVNICTNTIFTMCILGCSSPLSPPDQVQEFERAGPIKSLADANGPTGLKNHIGPYRVIPGDILEFQMPVVLRVISADLPDWLKPVYGHKDVESYLVRVS